MRLWLYSIKCTPIIDWQRRSTFTDVPDSAFKHNILLFCLDEHSRTHIVRVADYFTFITLLLKKKDSDQYNKAKFDYQQLIEDVNARMNNSSDQYSEYSEERAQWRAKQYIQDVEAKKVRVVVGYTKSAEYVRLRLRLTRESYRKKVLSVLRKPVLTEDGEQEMRVGDIGIEQILHERISSETEFLLERNIDLCSWIEITGAYEDVYMQPHYQRNSKALSVSQNNIRPVLFGKGTSETLAPSLRKLYMRVEANSFTATKQNQNNPSYEIREDEVNCVSLCTSDAQSLAPPMTFVLRKINERSTANLARHDIEVHNTERELLQAVGKFIAQRDIHILVLGSDEKCGPTSLFYLEKRAKLHGVFLGFSKLLDVTTRCDRRAVGKTGEMLIIDHFGMERVDVCQILPRAQLSPNLDGFTLIDAARHKALLSKKDKEFFQSMINLDYVGTSSLSKPQMVVADNRMNVVLLRAIEQSSSFTLSQQEIARMCVLDITSVVERGQQARVGNLFYKWYNKEHIVINDQQTKKPYVVVNMPRQKSSYPRPPWLENPPAEAMRGAKRPGHIIREPLPKHVEFLKAMEHNNIFPDDNDDLFYPPCPVADGDGDDDPPMPPPVVVESKQEEEESKVSVASNGDQNLVHELCDQFAADLQIHAQKKTEQTLPMDEDDDDDDMIEGESIRAEKDRKKKEADDEKKEPSKPQWWENKRAADFKAKSRKRVKTQADKDAAIAYRGGCVLEALLGFYRLPEEAILTVDFASLYPSIMRAFRICYMRVIYDPMWLERSDVELEYIPITETQCVVFAKRHLIDGKWMLVDDITPAIVEDVMQLRDHVREQQKQYDKNSLDYKILDSRQLAAKVIANSTYGFTGSKTSQTPCTALAAAITQIGQWKIHTVRFIFVFFGNIAVYGDTDSNMIRFWVPPHLKTKDEIMAWIYEEGMRLVGVNMQVCIAPNRLEPETFKMPYLLLGKKTYAAGHYTVRLGAWNKEQPKDFQGNAIKGMAAKKRDKCGFAQDIGCTLANRFLDDPMVSFETLAAWFEAELAKIPMGPVSSIEQLNPFIITCMLNGEYKKPDAKSVKALHLAELTEEYVGARPRIGTRIPYVVTYKPKEKLQAQWCEIPAVFFKKESVLNIAYILNNHVLNVVKQILSLPMHEPLLRMFEKSVQTLITKWLNMQNKARELTHFYVPTCKPATKHVCK